MTNIKALYLYTLITTLLINFTLAQEEEPQLQVFTDATFPELIANEEFVFAVMYEPE